jgi:acetylornithine deacetylase/succinyl-diaminopimelate desuccinylase-like protein
VRFFEEEFVGRARSVSGDLQEVLLERTIGVTETAAPTNQEAARAAYVAELMRTAGLQDVAVDSLSNVTARISGKDRSKTLLLAGHTDTVFPIDTAISVTRTEDMLAAPGVGDNSVSVAAVVTLKSAYNALGEQPATDIVVTGNVGEEGLGDLRGMRAVCDAIPGLGAAIAVEGHSLSRITHRAIGSRRLRIRVTGPGGHSWGDAGKPSAIHHLATIVGNLARIPLKTDPKTSLNVGTIEGGISVNTIAAEATALLDMRSENEKALADLVRAAETVLKERAPDGIVVTYDVVGNRPAGATRADRGIVPIGVRSLTVLGIDVTTDASSTDANIPISRGIPAMCIGLTTGGNVHRLDEFIRIAPLRDGFAHLLLTSLAVSDALARNAL